MLKVHRAAGNLWSIGHNHSQQSYYNNNNTTEADCALCKWNGTKKPALHLSVMYFDVWHLYCVTIIHSGAFAGHEAELSRVEWNAVQRTSKRTDNKITS